MPNEVELRMSSFGKDFLDDGWQISFSHVLPTGRITCTISDYVLDILDQNFLIYPWVRVWASATLDIAVRREVLMAMQLSFFTAVKSAEVRELWGIRNIIPSGRLESS